MHHRRTLLTALLAVGLVAATAAPSSARPVERFPLDFSASGQVEDFCDVPGLTVDFTYDQTGTATVHQRGRDGQFYYQGHKRAVQTFTYGGRTLTNLMPAELEKDLSVTDNGDGTLTIIVLFTGAHRTLNEEGRIIAKNDGQIRARWVIDAESGDVLSQELIFGSTGTNDDFCEAALADWGL